MNGTSKQAEASAPGRLDVIGGIADYSGSLVLQTPVGLTATCQIRFEESDTVAVSSTKRDTVVVFDAVRLRPPGDLHELAAARQYFAETADHHWASYVVGPLLALEHEIGSVFDRGLSIELDSDVIEGAGISSSAAIEIATLRATLQLLGVNMTDPQMAAMCQIAENRVSGAACGIMDQMTSACGRPGALMKLRCQPAEIEGFVELPDGVSIWGVDSGERHRVAGSAYTRVRTAAFMGRAMMETASWGPVPGLDGYLANLEPSAFRTSHESRLPESMEGAVFLREYGSTADDVTSVVESETYPVRGATAFPVLENDRAGRMADLLSGPTTEKSLAMAGALMYLSHSGYVKCGLGSPGTNLLVELIKDVGYKRGLFGARITGGGSGGTVAVLGRSDALAKLTSLTERYEAETGLAATIIQSTG